MKAHKFIDEHERSIDEQNKFIYGPGTEVCKNCGIWKSASTGKIYKQSYDYRDSFVEANEDCNLEIIYSIIKQ